MTAKYDGHPAEVKKQDVSIAVGAFVIEAMLHVQRLCKSRSQVLLAHLILTSPPSTVGYSVLTPPTRYRDGDRFCRGSMRGRASAHLLAAAGLEC